MVDLLRGQQGRGGRHRLSPAGGLSAALGRAGVPDGPARAGRELFPPLSSGQGRVHPRRHRRVRLSAGSVCKPRLPVRLALDRHGAVEDGRADGQPRDRDDLPQAPVPVRLARHRDHACGRAAGAGRGLRRDGAASDRSVLSAFGGLRQHQCLHHQGRAGEIPRGRGHDLLLQQRRRAAALRLQRVTRGRHARRRRGDRPRLLVAGRAGRARADGDLLLLLPQPQAFRGVARQALPAADAGRELLHRGLFPA